MTLITVVIPTYNPKPEFLREALDSLANQTLDPNLFELIIVDDASDEPAGVQLLDELASCHDYAGIGMQVLRHDRNRWLAQARTSGAEAATSPYIQFLDDDDLLAEDYLEKCLLLLTATPDAAWVYTNILKFGQRNGFRSAPDFKFLTHFFRNDTPYASLFRRDIWLAEGQREVFLSETTRLFEDWDAYIRLTSKGHFGSAMTDTTFHYRRSESGLSYRSTREYAATIYLTYRMHLWRLALYPIGWFRFRRFLRHGRSSPRALSPTWLANRAVKRFAARYMKVYEFPAVFTGRTLRSAVTHPDRFVHDLIHDPEIVSLAAMRCGFHSAPDMSFTDENPFPWVPESKSVLAGHIWWRMGGAENIYLHWIEVAKEAGADAIFEAVQMTHDEDDVLKREFASVVDGQYAFDGFGQTPMQHLRGLWNLICLRRPKLIFISSNSYLYYLAPYIKKTFPNTVIIDILHNEFDGIVDWFTISADFDEYLDKRVVTSEYWKDLLVEKYGVEPTKIVVADNPVDTDLYDPGRFDRKEVLEELGLDPGKKTIGFIGRLHPQKGLDVFLALAAEMVDRRDVQFIIAGHGEERPKVLDAEKRLRNLHFLGAFSTVERVLAATDVLICPSVYEGAPLIGLECASMDTAIIAPDIVGFREQLADGDFGVSYQASMRVHEDARTIRSILDEEYDELIERGRRGRDWALKRHSLPVVGELYRSVLSSLLQQEPVARRLVHSRTREGLTLHVGLPKTGTTTIQTTLLANRDRLADKGVLYPLSGLSGPGHMRVAAAYLQEHERALGVWPDSTDPDRTVQEVLREFRSRASYERTLMSSEGFSQLNDEQIGRLLLRWSAQFDIDVIIFVRRQDRLMESNHSQNRRVRHPTFDRGDYLEANDLVLDLTGRVRPWVEHLGRDRVQVLEYDEKSRGCLVPSFLDAAGLLDYNITPVVDENLRLDRYAVEFLQYHTTLTFPETPYLEVVEALQGYSDSHHSAHEYRHFYSPAERAAVVESYSESNALLSERYFGGRLFLDVPPVDLDEPWLPFPGLDIERVASIDAWLAEAGLHPGDYR